MIDKELTIEEIQKLINDNIEMIDKIENHEYIAETDIINTLNCNITFLIVLQAIINKTEVS